MEHEMPAKGQPSPARGRTFPAEPLTRAEVASLIAQCSRRAPTGIRNRALVHLLYQSGLRITEALSLRPADVRMDKHEIRVLHGKGDKATVRGFHPLADDALLRWLDTRKALAAQHGWKNGPLFCTLDGQPLSDRYVRDMLKRQAAKAGIDKRVHPHGLRHTFAVELEEAGMPVTAISKLLGHSSVAVTHRYLDHLTNGQAVGALAALDLPALPDVPAPQPRSRASRAAVSPDQPPSKSAMPAPAAEPAQPPKAAVRTRRPAPAACAGTPADSGLHRWNAEEFCTACRELRSEMQD
jgi:integrase